MRSLACRCSRASVMRLRRRSPSWREPRATMPCGATWQNSNLHLPHHSLDHIADPCCYVSFSYPAHRGHDLDIKCCALQPDLIASEEKCCRLIHICIYPNDPLVPGGEAGCIRKCHSLVEKPMASRCQRFVRCCCSLLSMGSSKSVGKQASEHRGGARSKECTWRHMSGMATECKNSRHSGHRQCPGHIAPSMSEKKDAWDSAAQQC